MLSFNFTPFPVLETERLVLRQVNNEDVQEIFFLRSDPSVMQYLDRDPCRSEEEAMFFIGMINDGIDRNESIAWAITMKGNERLIGTIAFWRIEKAHHRAEIGYTLHPEYQGKGLMSEAMKAVLDYGFRVMNLHSVEANTNPANAASRKLLERHGFVQEAHFREDYYYNGKFLDSAIYSLITSVNQPVI